MGDESYKNIEDIVIGDMVKCYDQIKREIVDSKVTHVFHHLPEEMGEFYLVINDQLRVTPNHLIYSDGGWIEASDLKIGDSLFYPSIENRANSIKKVFDRVETFNIEVEGHHNYFVALGNEDTLVHNDDPSPPPSVFLKAIPGAGYSGTVNVGIQFQGSATGGTPPYVLYEWEFGDGNTSALQNPVHAYAEEGIYIVNLTVTDSAPGEDTKSTTASISYEPIARFKWFDKDGLDENKIIFFDAGLSSGANLFFWWDFDGVEGYEFNDTSPPYEEHTFSDAEPHDVTLRVWNTIGGEDTVTYTVQANTVGPEPDTKPWVLTGKDLWPDDTFSSHDEGYYINYTYLDSCAQGEIYLYEVKQKVSTIKPILAYSKLCALTDSVSYDVVKSALGFEGGDAIFNFNIEVEIQGDPEHPEPLYFGASDQENTIAKEATSRRVLIYYPPTASGDRIDRPPEYKHGEITVRVFIGGTPPS